MAQVWVLIWYFKLLTFCCFLVSQNVVLTMCLQHVTLWDFTITWQLVGEHHVPDVFLITSHFARWAPICAVISQALHHLVVCESKCVCMCVRECIYVYRVCAQVSVSMHVCIC